MLSLTDNPSRIPGRRTTSRGCSTAMASAIRLNTLGRSTPGVSLMISATPTIVAQQSMSDLPQCLLRLWTGAQLTEAFLKEPIEVLLGCLQLNER